MADRVNSDSRLNLSVATPNPIWKDGLRPDNPIPLSPQWLLPKPGEGKPGFGIMENDLNTHPNDGICIEHTKLSGYMKEKHVHDLGMQKDPFGPSLLNMETGGGGHQRDRLWGDEERDTNSVIHKDRWREAGDKKISDTRKIDKWSSENLPVRQFEARRVTSERWNTRWGPEDKERESLSEKWIEPGREISNTLLDKGVSQLKSHAKDERVVDYHRPWRSNSSQIRGRGEPSHQKTLTPNKQVPMFSYGRGRGENSPPIFGHGRGRVPTSASPALRMTSDKGECIHRESSFLSYSRTKLIDVYKTTDMRSSWNLIDGFVQVPCLTQEESLEPLALSAPTDEESIIFKGIDNGDIVSSGAPQISKDGSVGRNSSDFIESRRSSFDDLAFVAEDYKAEGTVKSKGGYSNSLEGSIREAMHLNMKMDTLQGHQIHSDNQFSTEDSSPYRKADELPARRESSFQGSPVLVGNTWKSPIIGERSNTALNNMRPITSEMNCSQPLNGPNKCQGSSGNPSYPRNELKWQVSEDPFKSLPNGISNREHELRKFILPCPEDLVLYYKDPRGETQGPFSGSDIIGWFESGYFGIDLQVRLASAPNDTAFSLLGDVMPHLRAKAGPPPGFTFPNQNEIITEAPVRPSFGSFGNLHGSSSEIDTRKSEPRQLHGSATEAENRFLESLMANNINRSPLEKFGFSEGLQGLNGNNSNGAPPMGVENGNNLYFLAKQKELERQKSLGSPYPYWPSNDASSMIQNPEMPYSNLLNPLQQQPQSQNIDLMAILHGLPDRSSSSVSNSGNNWSNLTMQNGVEISNQPKMEFSHGHNFPPQVPFGIDAQRLQQQNQLANLLSQTLDNPSGIPQDQQYLNMLQPQQYLLQLQSNPHVQSAQQLMLLDNMLFLKQQQQLEEQQQVLRQQQLLSQVLSDHHSLKHFGEPSSLYGHFPDTTVPPSQELFQISSNMPINDIQNGQNMNFSNPSPQQISQDLNFSMKMVENAVPEQAIESQHIEPPVSSPMNDCLNSLQVIDTSSEAPSVLPKVLDPVSDYASLALHKTLEKTSRTDDTLTINGPGTISEGVSSKSPVALDAISSVGTDENKLTPDLIYEVKINPEDSFVEPSLVTPFENIEVSEVKKGSDKKPRKQKASKKSSSLGKNKKSETEETNVADTTTQIDTVETFYEKSTPNAIDIVETMDSVDIKDETMVNKQGQSGQRVWKHTPGFKAKSLLEIQQEEQKKDQNQTETIFSEIKSVTPTNLSAPWAGIVGNSDFKSSHLAHVISDNSLNVKSKKGQLHDLLAKEKDIEALSNTFSSIPPLTEPVSQLDDDNRNFIEAKDTKKNRKKSAKAKGGAKITQLSHARALDISVGSSLTNDNGKNTRQKEKEELLPPLPSGPSFGDFVLWKGDTANAVSAPAWSSDAGKLHKPTSLRDILKEQEKKVSSAQQQSQILMNQKVPTVQATRGSVPLWSSPSKTAASPIQITSNAVSANSKYKGEDDLFWGTNDQPKQEAKQADFPQLASQGSRGTKTNIVKGTPGGSRQKSAGGKTTERSLSSSPASVQSSLKGKRDSMTKYSEAMDFRDWCVSESVRLIGTKDTNFLEFCLKQSRSEAELLLKENLGSFDPKHEFIDKFLNYKELLPSEVLEIAFQTRNDHNAPGLSSKNVNSDHTAVSEIDTTKGEGNKKGKKGKKGKKVSPSVLGFNVVSNRIMMGEIQTLDD